MRIAGSKIALVLQSTDVVEPFESAYRLGGIWLHFASATAAGVCRLLDVCLRLKPFRRRVSGVSTKLL